MLAFVDEIKARTDGLRAIVHNASAWLTEKPGTLLTNMLPAITQIHVNTPYLLNHVLEGLLRDHGHTASDIIRFADYIMERDSDKHIAYATSKTTLDNMARSFSCELTPGVRVNAAAPSFILSNGGDDAKYH